MSQLNKYDSLLFDLDGTLWDLSRAMAFAINKVYQHFGINKQVSDVFARYVCSLPYSQYSAVLLEGVPPELQHDVLPFLEDYANSSVDQYSDIALYDGVIEGLSTLATRYPLFLISNCGTNYLNLFLEQTSVGKLFTEALCHGHNHKSKAENIALIVEKHNLQSACYIGDSPSDEGAAKDGGVDFFFAAYGACFNSALTDTKRFESFFDLTDYFMK